MTHAPRADFPRQRAAAALALALLAAPAALRAAPQPDLTPVYFDARANIYYDESARFTTASRPFRQGGGSFSWSGSTTEAGGSFSWNAEFSAYGGSTPTLQLTHTASGSTSMENGNRVSVSQGYSFVVRNIAPLPAGVTKVPLELPVHVSLLTTQLPPTSGPTNTKGSILARVTRTQTGVPGTEYLVYFDACINATYFLCRGNSVTYDNVLQLDTAPGVENRLTLYLGTEIGTVVPGAGLDAYFHGNIDPVPQLSTTADPVAYGLPAGSTFADYFALSFSPNLYTVAQLPVPEPASWMLSLAGLGVLAGARRRAA